MTGLWPVAAFFACAFLAGSVNFSILVSRISGKGDVRKDGSGNPGTINTMRVLGKVWAAVVLVLDVGRGAGTILLAQILIAGDWQPLVAAAGVLLGNIFPVFHGFKGGKGVATTIGLMYALDPVAGAAGLGVWLAVVLLVARRSSVGSLSMVASYPGVLALRGAGLAAVVFAAAIFLLVIFTHRTNLCRLIHREEPKLF